MNSDSVRLIYVELMTDCRYPNSYFIGVKWLTVLELVINGHSHCILLLLLLLLIIIYEDRVVRMLWKFHWCRQRAGKSVLRRSSAQFPALSLRVIMDTLSLSSPDRWPLTIHGEQEINEPVDESSAIIIQRRRFAKWSRFGFVSPPPEVRTHSRRRVLTSKTRSYTAWRISVC